MGVRGTMISEINKLSPLPRYEPRTSLVANRHANHWAKMTWWLLPWLFLFGWEVWRYIFVMWHINHLTDNWQIMHFYSCLKMSKLLFFFISLFFTFILLKIMNFLSAGLVREYFDRGMPLRTKKLADNLLVEIILLVVKQVFPFFSFTNGIIRRESAPSRVGLEVELALRIQLKVSLICFGGLNTALGMLY